MYKIELNEDQLCTIVEALDVYGRLCCIQFDEPMFLQRISEISEEYELDTNKLKNLIDDLARLTKHYTLGRGASWCASSFIKKMYHIQKSISHVLCNSNKVSDPNHTCTRCEGPILTNDLPKISVESIRK